MPLNLVRRGGGILRKLPVNGTLAQPVRVISSQHHIRRIAFVARRSSPATVANRLSCSGSIVGNLVRSYATQGRPAGKSQSKSTKTTKTAKKPAKKPTKPRGLTEKQKENKKAKELIQEKKELKQTALTIPKLLPVSAYALALQSKYAEVDIRAYSNRNEAFKRASELAQAIGPEERQRYTEQAEANKVANHETYKTWVSRHTPLQIFEANKARRRLATLEKKSYPQIQDDRLVKRPLTAWIHFYTERLDKNANSAIKDQAVSIANEWKSLPDSAKAEYFRKAKVDQERYSREHLRVYGSPPPNAAGEP
ncbi:hypothetical protein BDV18DRAFT_83308 [Aspergillus unguis]